MPASIHRYMSGTVLPSVLCRFRVAHLLHIIVQPADGKCGLPACCPPPVQLLAVALDH